MITGRVKQLTGRGIGPGGGITRGVGGATETPRVVEGTLGTEAEETDEPPLQNKEFLLELWRASEELDPPPQKTSEWVGEFDEGGDATKIKASPE